MLVRSLLAPALLLPCAGCAALTAPDALELRPGTAHSSDGVPIHYLAGGRGDVALVFVHGWLGNASWWEPVLDAFALRYRVVALDLAGHGRSGGERTDWSVEHFAGDVAAVVQALELENVVLLGHSMSGAITVEAARRLGPRLRLLVPVDTLNDLDWDLSPEVWAQFFGGLRADFPKAVEEFFRGRLFRPSSPPDAVERVVAEARAAEPERSVRMLERARVYDVRGAIGTLDLPIHALNSDLNETQLVSNRRYAPRFEATLMAGVGHWPMLEDPAGFAAALERVLEVEGLRRAPG